MVLCLARGARGVSPFYCPSLWTPMLFKLSNISSDLIGGLTNDPAIDTNGDIFKFCVNVEKICVKKGVTIYKGVGVKKINLVKSSNGRYGFNKAEM